MDENFGVLLLTPILCLFAVLLVIRFAPVVTESHWVGTASHGQSCGGMREDNKPILGRLPQEP
jgi:hypothetical protein